MSAPLESLRVLELTHDVAGDYAGKLLADYGADVLKVEPPGGDPLRAYGPFLKDQPDPEGSGLFLHLNTNKRSVVIDASGLAGARRIRELAATADIVLEDFAPGQPDAFGFGWKQLSQEHPDLVMCSITPFGQTGPYRDFKGSEITLQAMGGPMLLNGHADREPIKLAGHEAQYHAGAVAAYAALLVRYRVEHGGAGDHVDLAVYECQAGCRDRRTIYLTASSYTGLVQKRGGSDVFMASGVRECMDGHVNITGGGARLPSFLAMIGREDLLDNPDIRNPPGSVPEDLLNDVERSFTAFLMARGKLDALAAAQAGHMPSGAIMKVDDLLRDAHYRGRGAWDVIDHPHTGPLEHPGRQMIFSASPRPAPARAPLLDEHAGDLNAGRTWRERVAAPAAQGATGSSARSTGLPLAGVRVADLTVVWAGPHVTQILAEWGADVVRVEPLTHIQPSTRGAEQRFTKEQTRRLAESGRLYPAYPDFDPGDDPWNRNPSFNSHARNKRSMACDVMTPEGREAFLRLIAVSDVFVENNVPETIERAGLTWEQLREVNPRLVMLRMPGFGLSGPYKNYRTFGHQAEGMIGHHYVRGYPDAGPEYTGAALTSDGFAGVLGAVAVMMGLRHRDRTGEGQQVEMPLAEAFIPVLGEFVLDYTMNGRVTPPQGNAHRHDAPHGVYPTVGDDQWIAIHVTHDDEFRALCDVLGAPALATDERFADGASRLRQRDALDAELRALTRGRDKERLFRELQAVGVISAPLHDELEALADEQLNARNWFREITMPGVGTHRYPGYHFKVRNTADDVRLPPARLGEHSEEIYLDLLGYSRAEYDALLARGLVGTKYAAGVAP